MSAWLILDLYGQECGCNCRHLDGMQRQCLGKQSRRLRDREWHPCHARLSCSTLGLFGPSVKNGETGGLREGDQRQKGAAGFEWEDFLSSFPWEVQSVRSRINRCSGTYDPFFSATCPCSACFLLVILFLSFRFDEFPSLLNGPCTAQLLIVA